MSHLSLSFEQFSGKLVKGIITQTCGPRDKHFPEQIVHSQFYHHVVDSQHPLPVRQLGVFLFYLHIVDEIDDTALRQGERATLYMQRRVRKHIKLTPESEVLLVVRQELQMITQVTVNVYGVLNIEPVE